MYFGHYLATLKNIGDKTQSLFERKKKEVSDLAAEKATEAQTYAEEQAKKVGESIEQTKNEASGIIGGASEFSFFFFAISFSEMKMHLIWFLKMHSVKGFSPSIVAHFNNKIYSNFQLMKPTLH